MSVARRAFKVPDIHRPITQVEKALHDSWLKAVLEQGLFSLDSVRLREQLGKLIAQREDWEGTDNGD